MWLIHRETSYCALIGIDVYLGCIDLVKSAKIMNREGRIAINDVSLVSLEKNTKTGH